MLPCNMLRHYTLDAINPECTMSNRHACNCSTPNSKNRVKSRIRVLADKEHLALGIKQIRTPRSCVSGSWI